MGISVGHVQPQLLICYESKGQSGPPFETKLPTITHSQRPILKPKIDPCPVNLTSKRASPFSSQIHRTRWLSLPAKVVVAEHPASFSWQVGVLGMLCVPFGHCRWRLSVTQLLFVFAFFASAASLSDGFQFGQQFDLGLSLSPEPRLDDRNSLEFFLSGEAQPCCSQFIGWWGAESGYGEHCQILERDRGAGS
jgi:hypothetical protein